MAVELKYFYEPIFTEERDGAESGTLIVGNRPALNTEENIFCKIGVDTFLLIG
jgi:hypothetical protein